MRAVRGIGEQLVEERVRAGQRVGGLQQRDDVEHRLRGGQVGEDRHRAAEGLGLGRAASQLEDGHDVVGRRRERDDVAMARTDAEPRLEPGDRAEGRKHLAQGHAAADRLVRAGAGVERRERRPVDGRVLADLERGEVEPERRELPAEVGELAVRDAPQPVRRERVLDDGELRVERLGIGVAAGPRAPSRR